MYIWYICMWMYLNRIYTEVISLLYPVLPPCGLTHSACRWCCSSAFSLFSVFSFAGTCLVLLLVGVFYTVYKLLKRRYLLVYNWSTVVLESCLWNISKYCKTNLPVKDAGPDPSIGSFSTLTLNWPLAEHDRLWHTQPENLFVQCVRYTRPIHQIQLLPRPSWMFAYYWLCFSTSLNPSFPLFKVWLRKK